MSVLDSDNRSFVRAVGIGVLVAILTAAVMLAATAAGLSPFPKPPSLALAEAVLGRALPLPVGLLFHAAYVTFWCVVYLRFFPRRGLGPALALGFALWLVILAFFFPLLGWGFAGLSVSPKLVVASFVPHLIFALLLWALDRYGTLKRMRA